MTEQHSPVAGAIMERQTTSVRLTPAEMTYFKKVTEGLRRAEALEAEANRLERQITQHRAQATALAGAHDSWVSHLVEQYQLDPALDQIDPESGMIERGQRSATNGRAEAD